MPQVWLSYEELAEFIDVPLAGARDEAIRRGFDRRKSHDGLTRVKLPEPLARSYMTEFALQHFDAGVTADALRRLLDAKTAREPGRCDDGHALAAA